MESKAKELFLPILYGLKSISEVSSFLVFLVVFLILFVVGVFVIINVLGLGAFIGKTVYSPSAYAVIAGESAFLLSVLAVIFSLCVLFYYKSYYIVSNELRFSSLLRQSVVKFPKFLIGVFIQVFVSVIGLIALIVPGVYYGSSLMFFGFFCVYGNSTVSSAFSKSRELAKKVRLGSVLSFLVYIVLLFIFVYVVVTSRIPSFYSGLLMSLLLSYWVISYSNTIFSIADRNYNVGPEKHYSAGFAGRYTRANMH